MTLIVGSNARTYKEIPIHQTNSFCGRIIIRYIVLRWNCFIQLTLHPISAIDISKVQSSAIPKEYTKQFPPIMSWNKLSKHNSLSPSDAVPCQWSVFEPFCTIPGIDQRTKIAPPLNYMIYYTGKFFNQGYLLSPIVVLQIFLKHSRYVFGDVIIPRNVPVNCKPFIIS